MNGVSLERHVPAWSVSATALAAGLVALASMAPARADEKALAEQVRQLEERLRQLEARPAPVSAAAAPEAQAAEPAGPTIEASVVTLAQQVNRAGSADGSRRSRLNYRGDVTIELPAGSVAGAQGTAFGHLRFGQGTGVALRPTYTSTANSLAFETAAGADDSFAIVAQAYYKLEWPLGAGGFNDQKGNRLELNVGKMDLFGQFDQNAVAADEAAQFLNNAFVHNPLLDSGGDIAADAYGFAPGMRLAYTHVGDGSWQWGVSLGVFGAGAGANFSGGLGKPMTIAQFEVSPLQINGEPRGNYRLYAWTNGRTTDLAGAEQRHTGIGLSLDQRVGRDWNLFARAGRRTSGEGTFDRALTLGFEHGGRAWGRGHDAVGLAVGWLRTADAWKAATADGTTAGYAASGTEQLAELYYRVKLNEHLEVSPDLQIIRRPGGDSSAATARVFGLRAAIGF